MITKRLLSLPGDLAQIDALSGRPGAFQVSKRVLDDCNRQLAGINYSRTSPDSAHAR